MIRSFVAAAVPEEVRSGLDDLIREMTCLGIDARFPRPESIHLTLKFLGDVEEDRLRSVAGVLEGVARRIPVFELRVKGLGVFPYLSNPRVVWTGLDCERSLLADLQNLVEEGLAGLGFPRERREFQPHLTLGRIRSRRKIAHLIDFIERRGPKVDLGGFVVSEFHLFQSILRPEGAQYNRLQSFYLENLGP